MAASSTDLLRKLSRRWVGQIGAGGVADASTTTVPLASATNLATDTAVTVVIDRVDANGVATPSLEETIIGVVSGSNLVSCIRGAEGTAQAHDAGAVVEVLVTAKGLNDMMDAFLTAFNQDGTIRSGTVLTVPQVNDTSSDHQYVFSVCELTADRTVALPLLTANDTFVFANHTQTLTNKRRTRRVVDVTQSATPTINTDNTDVAVISGLAQAITSFTTNLSGAPSSTDLLEIQITDDGTARAITWGASFESSGNVTLPTTTVISTKLRVGLEWNSVTSKWSCVAVA